MSRLLLNSFNELKSRFNQINDKFNEIKFGLSLISQKRRNYYFKVFVCSSVAVTTTTFFSFHSLPLAMNEWKSFVSCYEYGDKRILDKELQQLAQTVWNDCNQKLNKSSDLVDFFPSIGCDTMSFGSIGLNGAFVGIPFYFIYNCVEDVKTIDIRFLGEHNPYAKWRSNSGQTFLKCLVLSDSAKKFAIARQIYAANNITVLLDCLNVCLSTIIALGLAQAILYRSKSKAWSSFQVRFVLRSLGFCFGFYFWLKMNQIITYFTSLSADKKAISLGDDYLNGAIEYYSKFKSRNATARDLMDDNQWKPFTEEGENKGLFKHFLTFERKINYLKDLRNKLKDDKQID